MLDGIAIVTRVYQMGALVKVLDRPYLDLTTPIGNGILALLSALAEDALRVRLINRTTRQVSATELGGIYFDRGVRILNDIDEADFELSTKHGAARGRLTLPAPRSLAVFSLPVVLAGFARSFPDVEIAVVVRDQNLDLVQHGIDLARRFGALQDSTLMCRRLTSVASYDTKRRRVHHD